MLLLASSNTEIRTDLLCQGRPSPCFRVYGTACQLWRFQVPTPPFSTTLYGKYVSHASVEPEGGGLASLYGASFHSLAFLCDHSTFTGPFCENRDAWMPRLLVALVGKLIYN